MIATDGDGQRSAVSGNLHLTDPDRSIRTPTPFGEYVIEPFLAVGTSDLPLEQLVGWVPSIPLESTDPRFPGVVVRDQSGTITIDLASDLNRQDGIALEDGGATTLIVESLDAHGFRGSWESSSGVVGHPDRGRFCAIRRGA